MKTIKYILSAWIVAAFALAGCSDELGGAQEVNQPSGETIRLGASLAAADTRLNLNDTGTQVDVTWSENDRITVFANGQSTPFLLTEGGGTGMALFEGTPETSYTVGDKLCAVYSMNEAVETDADGNLTLSIEGQTGELTDKYQYMYGEATYNGEGTAFLFKHLVTLLKVSFTLPEGVEKLTNITLRSGSLYTKATLVTSKIPSDIATESPYKTGDLLYSNQKANNGEYEASNVVALTGEFLPDANRVVTVYFYVLPAFAYNADWCPDWKDGINPSFSITDGEGKTCIVTGVLEGKQVEGGKMYRINTQLVQPVDFANEDTADGSSEQPYEIATADQLYAFMLRCNADIQNANGISYRNCSYKLMEDIVLDNEIAWTPIEGFWGSTFDGNHKTISGNILMNRGNGTGLFTALNEVTIRDLTLDLNVTFANVNDEALYDRFGMLTADLGNSTVTNCVNLSNVTGRFQRMAGLVCEFGWNNTMTACVNKGNITSLTETYCIGGIAATRNHNGTIQACYNTGLLSAAATWWDGLYAGGIVGYNNADLSWDEDANDFHILGCWSNTTLTVDGIPYAASQDNIHIGGIAGTMRGVGTLSNCYWNNASVTNLMGETDTTACDGCAAFASSTPDAAQIAALNEAIAETGYQFNEDGSLAVKQ